MRELFVSTSAASRDRDLLAAADGDGVAITLVTDRVVAAVSDTVTPQGIVAVVAARAANLTAARFDDVRLAVVVHDAADPGNLGTIVRTADAAGADAVVVTGDSADVWSPKAVRASAGSVFHLPVHRVADAARVITDLRAAGARVLATALDGDVDLPDAARNGTIDGRVAWLFGNEAHGLPADLVALADARIRIPIYGGAESLNLGAAAAICLYATAERHRAMP